MLKKLLVLSLVGIVLSGCNDSPKEVTEDMLIGKWKCGTTFLKTAKYDSDENPDKTDLFAPLFNDVDSVSGPIEYDTFPIYSKIDGITMVTYNNWTSPLNFGVEAKWKAPSWGTLEDKEELEYEPISRDSFNLIKKYYLRDPISKKIDSYLHQKQLCKRTFN